MTRAEAERMVAYVLRVRGKPYTGQEFVEAVDLLLAMHAAKLHTRSMLG